MDANHTRRALRGATALLFGLPLLGCAPGSGEGLSASGRPLDESADVPLAATLESIQANVFDTACIVCHSGAAAPLGLRLDADNSFTNLVGVRSRQDGSVLRVAPGDADRSYLVRKLEGTAKEGGRMPLGGAPLPQATIDFVRQWITDGASPDDTGANDLAPVVVTIGPPPDSVTTVYPAEITAGFDQDIDASTLNDQTFVLVRSGGDGVFGDGDDIVVAPVAVGLSAVNPRLAVMELDTGAAVADRYRITLAGSGPNVVLGVNGLALDGEYGGNLPSGDGAEGGDFVVEFEVQGLQPSLASIQANLFTPTCSVAGCHSGPAGPNLPGGMDLSSADASYASLVGVASVQEPLLLRVAPNDADGSYVVRKLEGTGSFQRMPFGGPYLDQGTIDVIRAWIDAGAGR